MASKTVKKLVLFSPEEYAKVKEEAANAGLNENAYIRLKLSDKPRDYADIRQLLKSLINEINKIGVNINQIVKDYNSGFYKEADKELLAVYLRKLIVTVNEAVKTIGNQ